LVPFLELSCLAMRYLDAKAPHVGADVDGLACSLDYPTTFNHQWGSQSILTGAAPFYHVVVDCSGTCKTKSYMEDLAFTEGMLI
jgi:hypothetical protein